MTGPLSERAKMVSGALYQPGDPELVAMRERAQRLMLAYNQTSLGDREVRRPLREALFGAVGEGSEIRAPVYVDYGVNIHIGAGVFLNNGCVLLDVCPITIGDKTQIGPMSQILTADHPRDAGLRDEGLEYGRAIAIGRNVWIGAGALILPGVQIGDDAIIGAGSVVTRDVAAGRKVMGNPARPG